MLGSIIFRILLISHLISTKCTHLPAPFLAHPLGNTDGSNSSGLSDYNVTILVTRCIIIQNDLWYMSCLSWSSGTLDYSHLITFDCVKNLQRLKKKKAFKKITVIFLIFLFVFNCISDVHHLIIFWREKKILNKVQYTANILIIKWSYFVNPDKIIPRSFEILNYFFDF